MSPVKKRAGRRAGTTTGGKQYGYESIHKDPLDLRDFMYEGSLVELPRTLDNSDKVPRPILNQETEGACTGFGLAAVVNYLMVTHREARDWGAATRGGGASSRMMYEMAKRYDEWPGEDYEGSSIRAAMKGWHRHGVCREALWRYRPGVPGTPTSAVWADAVTRPLGNYFRVRHLHLSQMHAALREVGIVYASAQVHTGWQSPTGGRIERSTASIGGHAFAIVGYDERGFIIQNSWGSAWGQGGFANLSYEDWLENAWDCWVARLGVPIERAGEAGRSARGVGAQFGTVAEASALHGIRGHFVNLGNDGALSRSGRFSTTEADLAHIFETSGHLEDELTGWKRPRILLYAHGGLNSEGASAERVARMLPHFLANEIYPLHFMWETGVLETFRNIIQDAFRQKRMAAWTPGLWDRFRDLVDEGIELGVRPLGRPVWSEMKENAALASGRGGGAALVGACLAAFLQRHPKVELHLAGHSAGGILLAHLIPELANLRVQAESLTLFAPAITSRAFSRLVVPRLGGPIKRLAMFNLDDPTERDDTVLTYGKSLLYLVSEACEPKRGEPLLGMERYREDDDIGHALGAPHKAEHGTVIYATSRPGNVTLSSRSKTHSGFDDDPDTLNSLIRFVTGRVSQSPFTAAAARFGPAGARSV